MTCYDDDQLQVLCVNNADGALASHDFLANPTCNGGHASFVNPNQVIAGCSTEIAIIDVATLTPVP